MLDVSIIPALSDNYIYLVRESVSGEVAVIDPAEARPVIDLLEQNGWRLDYIFNTHHHNDHVGANLQLKHYTGCRIVGSATDRQRIPGIDIAVSEGDRICLGGHAFQVFETFGHTIGHIVYYCADSHILFCGDTLFSLGCGRLFEGSATQMWQSLQKLKALPADTLVYCAHEYTTANGRFALSVEPDNAALHQRLAEVAEQRTQNRPSLPSSIGQELATNPFFREHSPAIRSHIGMSTEDNIAVFAKLRSLKDQFR